MHKVRHRMEARNTRLSRNGLFYGGKGVNEKFPELCRYIKKTKAQGFVESAMHLDEYLYNRWGMQTGREWTVYIN